MTYVYDRQRHLVCLPYSIDGLHAMAAALGIGRHWFHCNHYDIPKRMVATIAARCVEARPRQVLAIINGTIDGIEQLESTCA